MRKIWGVVKRLPKTLVPEYSIQNRFAMLALYNYLNLDETYTCIADDDEEGGMMYYDFENYWIMISSNIF